MKFKQIIFLFIVGILGWLVPGGGHFAINRRKHALIIFFTIIITFTIGLYIGSISIINPTGSKPWFVAQMMNTPAVAALCYFLPKNGNYVYGRPGEIGQIYTSITGLLNLLCIVNAVYLAHLIKSKHTGE